MENMEKANVVRQRVDEASLLFILIPLFFSTWGSVMVCGCVGDFIQPAYRYILYVIRLYPIMTQLAVMAGVTLNLLVLYSDLEESYIAKDFAKTLSCPRSPEGLVSMIDDWFDVNEPSLSKEEIVRARQAAQKNLRALLIMYTAQAALLFGAGMYLMQL